MELNVRKHNLVILEQAQALINLYYQEANTGEMPPEREQYFLEQIKNRTELVAINMAELERQESGGRLQ